MEWALNLGTGLSLVGWLPVVGGWVYNLLTVWTTQRFFADACPVPQTFPPVSVLKPVRGLEKDLDRNLRSILHQTYPDYQVIYGVQDPADPALPLLQAIAEEFGPQRVSVVVADRSAGANGKVNNLLGILDQARHDLLVINDSDTWVPPDYLQTLVAPLADPQVGAVCTLFKLTHPHRWYEALEVLTINADFMPSVVFATVTGASGACLGPSLAFKRSTLTAIGGLASLADYLVEDYELGRRIWTGGQKVVILPYVIDAVVDLPHWRNWWAHQVYWDQNTRLAQPLPFAATVIIRSVPFALGLLLLHPFQPLYWWGLILTLGIRCTTTAMVARTLRDPLTLHYLAWLPLRDILGLVFWALAFTQPTVTWRGVRFRLEKGGKMTPLGLGT